MSADVDDVISVGGLDVPIEHTPFGPRPVSGGDAQLDSLQWVVNAALNGELGDLTGAVDRGESVSDGMVLARPALPADDLASARVQWRERTGTELGDDPYRVSVSWRGNGALFLPRPVLSALVRRLETMRAEWPKPPKPWLFTIDAIHLDPHPDEEAAMRMVEAQAAEFDLLAARRGDLEHEATVAARRRFLLAELETYGILTGQSGQHRARWLAQWHLPTLLGYQNAAIAIGEYWSSEPHRVRIGPPPQVPSVLGAAVSVDWFRAAEPSPTGWDDNDWLAFCERALSDAPAGTGYDGEIFIRQNGRKCRIFWRRDDGVHPSVVRGSAT